MIILLRQLTFDLYVAMRLIAYLLSFPMTTPPSVTFTSTAEKNDHIEHAADCVNPTFF